MCNLACDQQFTGCCNVQKKSHIFSFNCLAVLEINKCDLDLGRNLDEGSLGDHYVQVFVAVFVPLQKNYGVTE